jgi:hypothetical protein
VFACALLLSLRQSGQSLGAGFAAAALSVLLPALPGCLVGSALGVWVSRTMGWRKHWVVGAVLGAALAAISIAVV